MIELTEKLARNWSRIGPRATYGMCLLSLIEENEDVYALSADLGGSSGLRRVMNQYPGRYMNVGIAEQNLIGVAAGLAKEGLIPFVSSFAPFVTLRCADQIRMNMGYMHLNIKAVGLGSGVSMGYLGNSHYGVEDISFMRSIPDMVVLSPADCGSLAKAVQAAAEYKGPVYIRLTGEPGMPVVYKDDFDFRIGKAIELCKGEKVAIIATGSMVAVGLAVADKLNERRLSCAVVDMHTVKPIDEEILDRYAKKVDVIVTLEEHSIIGGLGAAIAQYLCMKAEHARVLTLGLPDCYAKAGGYEYMLEQFNLTPDAVAMRILETLSMD